MSAAPRKPSRMDLVRSGRTFDRPRTGRLVVGIDKVVENPRNERKVFRNMEGLIASVRAVGIVEPITVAACDDGRYQIITGHRRYRAARAAGLLQIEVLVRDAEAANAQRRKSLVSNIQREDIGPVELAEALQEWLDEDAEIRTQADLASAIGKDKTWVSAVLRILTLPVHLRQRVWTSQLSVSWESVARIARLEDASTQEELIDALLRGATHQAIRERIRDRSAPGQATPRRARAKPRIVFRASNDVTVLVLSETAEPPSADRVRLALEEALTAADRLEA